MVSLIAATAVSQRPRSSARIAPLLALAWLCLLPISEAACKLPYYDAPGTDHHGAYRPPADAPLPFDCTGHYSIDLTDWALTSFQMNATLQFDTCSKITELYLGCNNFATFEQGAFAGLSKLLFLWLSDNPFLYTLSQGAFQGLSALQTLDLSYNPSLDTLIPGVFQGLSKLQILNLGFNPTLNFESFIEASTDLNQLETIGLEGCGIAAGQMERLQICLN